MAQDDKIALIGQQFALQIDGVNEGFFQSIEGLGSRNEVVEYRANTTSGKENLRKMPGKIVWDDIVFRRGTTNEKNLSDWRQQVVDGKIDEARKNVSIVLYTPDYTEVSRWNVINAWPSSLRITNLNATNAEVSVEELTLVHEGVTR